jgi:hypothetical protein
MYLADKRHKQSLDMSRQFVHSHGADGERVYRFDWQNYKRLLRPSLKLQWTPVRMSTKSFYKKLYRLNSDDEDDWGKLLGSSNSTTKSSDGNSSYSTLKLEYLRSALKNQCCYSLPVERMDTNDEGEEQLVEHNIFFKVLNVVHAKNRMKLVKTAFDDEVASNAALAVHMLYYAVWSHDGDNAFTVYEETDPEYVNYLDVAPFGTMYRRMMIWQQRVSDVNQCFDLVDPVSARPTMGAHDPNCPTIMVINELKALGWNKVNRRLEHTATTGKVYDYANFQAKRRYFQVLLKLEDILPSNPTIASDQPIHYYELLLRGASGVETGQGSAAYIKQFKALKGGDAFLALTAPQPEASVALGDLALLAIEDEFDLGCGILAIEDELDPAPAELLDQAPAELPIVPVPCVDGDASSSSSSSSNSSSTEEFDAGVRPPSIPVWFPLLGAPPVKLDDYTPMGKSRYQRFIMNCSVHSSCCKKRSVTHVMNFGRVEPLAYLCAWNSLAATATKEQHSSRHFRVPLQLVQDWIVLLSNCADDLLNQV